MYTYLKQFQVLATLIIASIILTACQGGVAPLVVVEKPAETGPKQLVICQAQEPDTLYIYGGSMLAAGQVGDALGTHGSNFMSSLDFDYQPQALEALPSLEDGTAVLEKVTINPGDKGAYIDPASGEIVAEATALTEPLELNQLSLTFHIRPGLVWEDGTPVTAADYELSWMLYNHPDTPNPDRFLGEHVAEFRMLDESTQFVKLLPGWTPADFVIYFWSPLPNHILGSMAPADVVESEYARSPLSLGPFKMVEWIEGQHIRVTRNENYWRQGYPRLDEIIYKFVPDTNQLLAQLLSGECDVGTQDGMSLDQAPFLDQAAAEGILVPDYTRGTVWEHIDFGMTSTDGRYQFFGPLGYTDLSELNPADPASWAGTAAWEAAKKVRKAFAHCLDRQRMVDEALYGRSIIINSYLPKLHPMHPGDENLVTYDYNPALGKQLLAEAGWTDSDGDGFVDRNGLKFEVTLNTTSGNKMREIITQLTQENMKECGVEVIIELMPAREFFGDGPDGPLSGRHFDLGEFAWLTGVEVPASLYYCDQIPSAENGWSGGNDPGYCNPAYDQLGKKAQGILNRAEQAPLFAEAQRLFSDDLPALPLFQRVSVSATRPGVLNYKPNPTSNSALWNIWEWDIE